MSRANEPAPVDAVLPFSQLLLFGLQHVLVMAAVPITSVFLVAKALGLSAALTVNLISATFLLCGLGTLLQSFGPWKFGARLPFVMVPGGAPIVMFVTIAQQRDLQTASGAVILTALFYFLILPVFARCLRFFPKIVIGTLLLLVSINLVKVYGGIIAGKAGTPTFGDPVNIGLALATIGFTVLFARLFKGMLGQLAVLLGLLAGTLLAAAFGLMDFSPVAAGPVWSSPTLLPFGLPHFDLVAAVPLLIFSVISMVEATGQTVAVAEVVGRPIDPRDAVPRTVRGDALVSLLGGLFGTSMIITSGENIGIVRATNVRSRYVTAMAGAILVLIALSAPLGRLASAIPAAVVGGTAMVVFAIIGTMGIDMLRRTDLHERGNMFVLAGALTMGLLPILVPGLYSRFPDTLQLVLGNGLAMGSITAVVLNLLFNRPPAERAAPLPSAVPPQ
ncbi:nucleobase:cation symporter [Variovorax paradoxus]|jgi:uracil-xanthine permease|uniref:uracil-xanthine permease family protein n=1 Tax=Variovorax TaxID=34072 RepID=UPI0006E625EF|nr:nucleobase:cation symporter [Variovorax paradoxus]KPU91655.1 nucleobase:cation symporter [Variovorax paradoxus]KPU92701.1 nucleobase:cation symporter [Variovorax paradoxus]KPV14372.1 nucleobase:cation symporter [Variovorax paradoxus]KPV21081.1 nucleobase:cation symporter [Variovorax paradoxus]